MIQVLLAQLIVVGECTQAEADEAWRLVQDMQVSTYPSQVLDDARRGIRLAREAAARIAAERDAS